MTKEFKVSNYLKWYERPYYWLVNAWDSFYEYWSEPSVMKSAAFQTTAPHAVWYVAGPMSGIDQFNHPLFHKVTAILRSRGLSVINPAELDSDEMRVLAAASDTGDAEKLAYDCGESWGDVLARDVQLIANKVTTILLLPGWEQSRGARLELYVARLCDVRVCIWWDESSVPVTALDDEIRKGLNL